MTWKARDLAGFVKLVASVSSFSVVPSSTSSAVTFYFQVSTVSQWVWTQLLKELKRWLPYQNFSTDSVKNFHFDTTELFRVSYEHPVFIKEGVIHLHRRWLMYYFKSWISFWKQRNHYVFLKGLLIRPDTSSELSGQVVSVLPPPHIPPSSRYANASPFIYALLSTRIVNMVSF